jgi:hypothetical protein
MTMHEEWTDRLSEYLDDELTPPDRAAVEAHLRECAACAGVLNDLKRVVSQAQSLEARPPRHELWPGIAARIDRTAQPRRFSFTLPQLAAAAALLMAVSGTVVWQVIDRSVPAATVREGADMARAVPPVERGASADRQPLPEREASAERQPLPEREASAERQPLPEREASAERQGLASVSFSDAQYDAAVSDLEKALRAGRGRLDKQTIAIVEHNLQIIDQAIAQAREALSADPANGYLSSHLVEARRRKLDLLRRAAALAETD